MELRQLRYFLAVADARNFTRAAEHLGMAQPPLSRQVRQLEEELGVRLLDRDSRPLRLSEAGRVFYEQARQIVDRAERLAETMRQIGPAVRPTLKLGFVASTLYSGLPALVRHLRTLRPEVEIALVELTSMQQIPALKSGRIDAGFGRLRIEDPLLVRTVLREEALVLALSPSSALAATDGGVGLEVLRGRPLIVYPNEPRPSFADHVLGLLADRAVRPSQVHEVRDLQTALGLVAAEVGVCLIPTSARLRGDLDYRAVDDAGATSPIILTHRVSDGGWYLEAIKAFFGVGTPSAPSRA